MDFKFALTGQPSNNNVVLDEEHKIEESTISEGKDIVIDDDTNHNEKDKSKTEDEFTKVHSKNKKE